jgi:hypothetical protein
MTAATRSSAARVFSDRLGERFRRAGPPLTGEVSDIASTAGAAQAGKSLELLGRFCKVTE